MSEWKDPRLAEILNRLHEDELPDGAFEVVVNTMRDRALSHNDDAAVDYCDTMLDAHSVNKRMAAHGARPLYEHQQRHAKGTKTRRKNATGSHDPDRDRKIIALGWKLLETKEPHEITGIIANRGYGSKPTIRKVLQKAGIVEKRK